MLLKFSLIPFWACLPFCCDAHPKSNLIVSSKPNVIFIYADDLGYGDVGFNGSTTIRTPNIDKIAHQGVRFTNMHSASATCTPSRYALLTGEYAWRHEGTGIATGDAGSIISPERYTLADVFKSSGYHTGVIGKWHLGLGYKTGTQNWNGHITPGPSDLGFDYSFILAATGDRVPCVYVENEKVFNLSKNDSLFVSYQKNFEGEPTGKLNPELLKVYPSEGHDMSIVNGIGRIGFMKGGKSAIWKDEEISTMITSKAIEFINKNQTDPFFLYFSTHNIHVPRVPNPRFIGVSGMGPRGDAILELDWCVGELMKTIRKLNLDQNTIVVLTSDNGPVVDDGYKDTAVELLGNHRPAGNLRGGKYSIFEGGTRVPGILYWPSKVKPGVSDKLLSQIDIFASFAELLKVPLPHGAAPDSQNHLKAFLNKGGRGRKYFVVHNGYKSLALESPKWKLITSGEGPLNNSSIITRGNQSKDQLYNLSNDLSEKSNLVDKNPHLVVKLHKKLESIKSQNH